MIRNLPHLVAAAAIALAAATGCASKGDDDELSRLRAEPIMSARVAGTTGDQVEERPADKAMGKSSRATLLRVLSLLPDSESDVVLAATVDIALTDGWTADGGSPPPGGGWILHKPTMELRINIQDRVLNITLVEIA